MENYIESIISEVSETVDSIENNSTKRFLTYLFKNKIIDQQDLFDIMRGYSSIMEEHGML